MSRLDPSDSYQSALDHVSHTRGAARVGGFGRFGRVLQGLPAALCLVTLVTGAACGGDDSDSSSQPTAGAGGKAAAGSGGSAGASGGAAEPPKPVACGETMCYPPSNPLSGIIGMFGGGQLGGAIPMAVACCLDESAGKCGISTSPTATCEAPAVVDTRCPAANLGMLGPLLGANSMAGCCIDNKCGQDGKIFGRGCVENSQAKAMVSAVPLVGSMFMFPASQACDAPKMSTDDAGVSDVDGGV